MKIRRNSILLMIGLIIFFTGPFFLPAQAYFPCECGHSACARNFQTCSRRHCSCFPNPPSPPTLYQPTSPDLDGTITLFWSAVSGATSYRVYWSTSALGSYNYLGSTSNLFFTDINKPDGIWWYKVKSKNSAGTSGYSNEVSVTVGVILSPRANGHYTEYVMLDIAPDTITQIEYNLFDGEGWQSISGSKALHIPQGNYDLQVKGYSGSTPYTSDIVNFNTWDVEASGEQGLDWGADLINVRIVLVIRGAINIANNA